MRFSWQLVGGARGVAQAAYQVQVNAGERAVWDSGAVQSNQTLHVEYSGEQPLAADARYRWRVQVTDTRGGKSGFSPWQLLATALDSAEWEASGSSWINGDGRNQLRTEFPVPAEVHAAMAHASLFYSPVGYGLAWLNGVSVAPEAALGPWTTWSQRILYRCSDRRSRPPSCSLFSRWEEARSVAVEVWICGGVQAHDVVRVPCHCSWEAPVEAARCDLVAGVVLL